MSLFDNGEKSLSREEKQNHFIFTTEVLLPLINNQVVPLVQKNGDKEPEGIRTFAQHNGLPMPERFTTRIFVRENPIQIVLPDRQQELTSSAQVFLSWGVRSVSLNLISEKLFVVKNAKQDNSAILIENPEDLFTSIPSLQIYDCGNTANWIAKLWDSELLVRMQERLSY